MAKKILLDESEIPERWYNILPDLPGPPAPYLHPATLQPMGPADLAPIFPEAIIAQGVSAEPWIEITYDVRNVYKICRPSPVYRAERLEKALDTPAKIYFKYEGVSPAGSHKPNTAVPQAYYNAKEGVKRLTTETGAGQWGSALAFAGALFGLDVTVYMVKVSYEQKPYRRAMMETWGATVHASPTNLSNAGRGVLAQDADSPGSLVIATSEADPCPRRRRLWPRRRRGDGAGREHVPARTQLPARSDPLRRTSIPRRRTIAVPARRSQGCRGAGLPAKRVLCRGSTFGAPGGF